MDELVPLGWRARLVGNGPIQALGHVVAGERGLLVQRLEVNPAVPESTGYRLFRTAHARLLLQHGDGHFAWMRLIEKLLVDAVQALEHGLRDNRWSALGACRLFGVPLEDVFANRVSAPLHDRSDFLHAVPIVVKGLHDRGFASADVVVLHASGRLQD